MQKNERNQRPDEDLCVYILGNMTYIQLYNLDLIKEYFVEKSDYFMKDLRIMENVKRLAGEGLLFSEGHVWKKKRRVISQLFNFNFLIQHIPTVVEIADKVLNEMKPDGITQYCLIEQAQKITSSVVIHNFFGADLSDKTLDGQPLSVGLEKLIGDASTLGYNLHSLILGNWINYQGLTSIGRSINRRIKEFKQIGLELVKAKIAKCQDPTYVKPQKMDLIESIITQFKIVERNEDNQQDCYTYQDLVDEFCTFFIAGMDTTGHWIGMAIYVLTQHPEIEEKLREEINEYIKSENDMNYDNIKKMEYLNNFLTEVLRQYSPAPALLQRIVKQDVTLGTYQIKKGASISVGFIQQFFFDKNFPNSQEFNPDRWKTPPTNNYAFTPFSAGNRNCIGQHLAYFEAKIVTILWLKKFKTTLIPNYQLKMTTRFLYEPKEPLMVTLTE